MTTKFIFEEGEKTVPFLDDENEFYKEVAQIISKLNIPNRVNIETPNGNAIYNIVKKSNTMFVMEESNNITFTSTTVYGEKYLTCVNADKNNYKFYQLEDVNGECKVTYGRIGSEEGDRFGVRTYTYPRRMFWIKYYEKIAKGYVDKSQIFLSLNKLKTKDLEKVNEIDSVGEKLYQKLMSYAKKLIKKTFVSRVITKEMVTEAEKLLTELYKTETVEEFNKVLLELICVSPRRVSDVKRLLAKDSEDFSKILDREETLCGAMGIIIKDEEREMASSVKKNDSFLESGVEVYLATDKQKDCVLKHLNNSLKSKVKTVYRIIPKEQQKRFDEYIQTNEIKTVKQLWHGSRNENWLSIIMNSLKLNPNAVITGKMFGHGIYFASSSMKSWGYTDCGKWVNGRAQSSVFMGLYATAYGKPLDVTHAHSYSKDTINGYNCVHAHAGPQLLNDEIIYYDEDAMVLNYLVEFNI